MTQTLEMLSVDDLVAEQLVMFDSGLSPSFDTVIRQDLAQLEVVFNYVSLEEDLRCFLKYRFQSDQACYTCGAVFEAVEDVQACSAVIKLADQRPLAEVVLQLEQTLDRSPSVLCVKADGPKSWTQIKCLEPEELGFPVCGLSDGQAVSVRSREHELLDSRRSILVASTNLKQPPVGLTPDGRIQYKTVRHESNVLFVCQKRVHVFDVTALSDTCPQFFLCQRTEKWSSTSPSARLFRRR